MKFDEAFKIIHNEKFGMSIKDETPRHTGDPEKIDFVITDDGVGTGIEKLSNLITQLKEEYAPPVKMTKNDKDILLYNIENYSFDVFAENISLSDKEKFGLPANKEFQGLSIEDLMRAWLHPDSIEEVE